VPIFRTQVHYTKGTNGKWSNVWHCDAVDLPTVVEAWNTAGVPDLLPVLANSCILHSLLVSDEASSDFLTSLVDAAGTSTAAGDLLPLFNACRVFFTDGSLGRQDNKFFKGFVTENIQADGELLSGTVTAVNGLLATLITDMAAAGATLVSSSGDPYTLAVTQVEVQMRQMHRKRKKVVAGP
jgi:hypothetical protein